MTYQITMEIEHLEEGPYLGTSPDLPGLIVQADTPERVIQLAPQLAHELIASLMREGDPLPKTLREAAEPYRVQVMVPA
jgi:predicted RNase H-like HicB family nuclease